MTEQRKIALMKQERKVIKDTRETGIMSEEKLRICDDFLDAVLVLICPNQVPQIKVSCFMTLF